MKTLGSKTFICFIALTCLFAAAGFAGAGTRMEYVEGEALVVIESPGNIAAMDGASIEARLSASAESVASIVGAKAVRTYGALAAASGKNIVFLRAEGKNTKELHDALGKATGDLGAAPKYIFRAMVTPNDTRYNEH